MYACWEITNTYRDITHSISLLLRRVYQSPVWIGWKLWGGSIKVPQQWAAWTPKQLKNVLWARLLQDHQLLLVNSTQQSRLCICCRILVCVLNFRHTCRQFKSFVLEQRTSRWQLHRNGSGLANKWGQFVEPIIPLWLICIYSVTTFMDLATAISRSLSSTCHFLLKLWSKPA